MVSPLKRRRRTHPLRPAAGALLALLVLGCADASGGDPVRGVIISTHTDGTDWDTPTMRSTIEDIQAVGAGWISTHPYAWIRGNGEVVFREFDPDNPPDHLVHPIREAHALGLQVLIKPHLGYWGSRFSWRGDIAFETDEQWERFFRTYQRWIVLTARACREADGFVVGTELDSTLAYTEQWRRIIAEVKEHTSIPLTYAANWTHYREVRFWDDLDVIGIQAYFPLTENPDASENELAAGWARIMPDLAEYSRIHNRSILFTELGYNRSHQASVTPWTYHVDGPEAEETQARCLEAALVAVRSEPSVVGAFLWKWFPNPYPVGRNFQLATPALKQVITRSWTR